MKSDLSSKILSSEAENSIEQISDYSSSSTSIINPFYSSLESEQKSESEIYDSSQGKIDLSTNTNKNIDLVTTDLSTKENILTSDSSIISKESSNIISNTNTYDFYESSQIFNTEPNITIYNESEIVSQLSTNINNYSQDINPISYSINTENSIIENSENISNVRTNEYNYRTESIIHTNTNEKNTYGISDMSYGLYTSDIKSESNFERTTDFTTTDNKFSDIISHSSMDINRTTEKYNSEIASDFSFDTIKQSDSTIKTSEISESYKGIYGTNNIKENENKDSFIAETNPIESEKKLITDSGEIIKKDSSEIISTNSKKELINYSSEILYNTSGRSEEAYKYYSSISDYSEFKYENKTDLTTNSIKTSDISFGSSQKIISSSNEYTNETNIYDISTISSSINKEKSSDSNMNSNQPQETNFDSSFIQTENETKILDTILNTKESESDYNSNIMSDTNLKSTTKTYDYSSNIISIPNQTDKQSTSKTTTEWITTKESSIDTILGSTSKIDEIVKESSDLINGSNKNTYYKDNKSEIGLESNMETELSSQSIDRLTDSHMIINESTIDFKNDTSKFSNKEVFSNSIETAKYSSEITDSQKSIIKERSEITSDTKININESQSDYSSNIIFDTNIKTTEKFEQSSEIITFPTETENQSTSQPKTEGREDNGSTSIINENTDSNIISSSAIKANTDKFIDTSSEISQDSSVKLNISYISESFKKMSDSNIITNSDTIISSNSYIGEKTLITSQSDSKESSEIISYTTPKVNENQSDYSSYIISDTDIKTKATFISSSDIFSIPTETDKQSISQIITDKESDTSSTSNILGTSSEISSDTSSHIYGNKGTEDQVQMSSESTNKISDITYDIERVTTTNLIAQEETQKSEIISSDSTNLISKESSEFISNTYPEIETEYSSNMNNNSNIPEDIQKVNNTEDYVLYESSEIKSDKSSNIIQNQTDFSSSFISDTNIKTTEYIFENQSISTESNIVLTSMVTTEKIINTNNLTELTSESSSNIVGKKESSSDIIYDSFSNEVDESNISESTKKISKSTIFESQKSDSSEEPWSGAGTIPNNVKYNSIIISSELSSESDFISTYEIKSNSEKLKSTQPSINIPQNSKTISSSEFNNDSTNDQNLETIFNQTEIYSEIILKSTVPKSTLKKPEITEFQLDNFSEIVSESSYERIEQNESSFLTPKISSLPDLNNGPGSEREEPIFSNDNKSDAYIPTNFGSYSNINSLANTQDKYGINSESYSEVKSHMSDTTFYTSKNSDKDKSQYSDIDSKSSINNPSTNINSTSFEFPTEPNLQTNLNITSEITNNDIPQTSFVSNTIINSDIVSNPKKVLK